MGKKQLKNSPIGIFDSGLGGLTVLRAIKKVLPKESIVYLGDTARLPYGTKSKSAIVKFSEENTKFLLSKGVKLIVVACNTSSSVALEKLRKKFSIPIFGVIEPGSKRAVELSKTGKIGVIGTTATIKSGSYKKMIKSFDKNAKVFDRACPLFVPFIEEGWSNHPILHEVAKVYLGELKIKNIDTLVLGCTHYPLIKETLSKIMGKKVKLIDSGEAVSLEVKNFLLKNKLLAKNKNPFYHYYLTDKPQRFKEMAEMFLGEKISYIKKVNLESKK